MSDAYPARRTVSLNDCVLLCCLPLTEQAFEELRAASDFCGQYDSWEEYNRKTSASRRQEEYAMLSELGLRGTQTATMDAFRRAVRDRPPIIALLGHCRARTEIEFADGYASLRDIVSAVPEDFDGVMDVSVCNPEDLGALMRQRANGSLTRFFPRPANAHEYLLYYTTLFTNVARTASYGAAFIQTISAFNQLFESDGYRW